MASEIIDNRDQLPAKRNDILLLASPKVDLAGGTDYGDHRKHWSKLDLALAKHPSMVLLDGRSPRGPT